MNRPAGTVANRNCFSSKQHAIRLVGIFQLAIHHLIVHIAYILQRFRQIQILGPLAGKPEKQFGKFAQPFVRTIDHRGIQRVRNLLARGMHILYRVCVLHFHTDELHQICLAGDWRQCGPQRFNPHFQAAHGIHGVKQLPERHGEHLMTVKYDSRSIRRIAAQPAFILLFGRVLWFESG